MLKGNAFITDLEGSLVVGYEDLEVEAFGGMDYEATYTFDSANREKLKIALEQEGMSGSVREMILAYFGDCLDKEPFSVFCESRDITYELFTWIS